MKVTFKHTPRTVATGIRTRMGGGATAVVTPLLGEQRLGVWRLRRALHASESGPWYQAEHALAGGQLAALIVFQRSSDNAALMLRFADMVAELANLQHHNIVAPIDSGLTLQGQPFLVLPWVDAEPLLQAVENLGLRERVGLVVQLCDALAHAHSEGLMLIEFDPANVWVLPDGRLQLMAVQLGSEPRVEAPPPGLRVYASPERLAGMAGGMASEAYALGVLLRQLVEQTQLSWSELNVTERGHLDALLDRASAPTLADRHPNSEALGIALREWLAAPGGQVVHAAGHTAGAPALPVFEAPVTAPKHRSMRAALIAVVVAVALIVGWAGHEIYVAPAVAANPGR